MSLQGVGLAYRRATMRADPSDGSKTIFLQEGGVELHGEYPRQFKSSIEHFAAQAFLGVCKRATGERQRAAGVPVQSTHSLDSLSPLSRLPFVLC